MLFAVEALRERTTAVEVLGTDMTIESKRKPRQDDRDRDERERMRHEDVERERMRQEDALDEALKNTFPASDPVSAEQP